VVLNISGQVVSSTGLAASTCASVKRGISVGIAVSVTVAVLVTVSVAISTGVDVGKTSEELNAVPDSTQEDRKKDKNNIRINAGVCFTIHPLGLV
jgi:hypothetical protein